MLDKYQEHWPDYMAVTEIAANSTINTIISKAPFEVLYGKNFPLPVGCLLFRESSISTHAHKFARKMHHLVKKVKSAIHDA